jgi:uncharacterized protein YaiE (UPF0345 family)
MAITFVRSYGFSRNVANVGTMTLGGLTFTTGNMAIITVAWYNSISDAITVADSNGNTWQKVPNTFQINAATGTPNAGQQVWFANITTGSAGITITTTFHATVFAPAIYGCEAFGVTLVDQSASNQGNPAAAAVSPSITTTAATFMYGSIYDDGAVNSGYGTSWTGIQDTFNVYLNEYRIPGVIESRTATTNSASATKFTAAIVAFKAASVVTTAKPVVVIMQS